ncbi:putative serine/threonine protein kinase IREH1 [Zea mays]|nr:putative serine/threonine protein kinase IREH1 [Zea mays]
MTEDSDGLNEFESSANVNYSFSNFSFKLRCRIMLPSIMICSPKD